jgi:nucleoside-diphosphate-sugar epimerase
MKNTENKPIVLITGSAGFIGTRTIEELISDYAVVGLDIEELDKPVKASV